MEVLRRFQELVAQNWWRRKALASAWEAKSVALGGVRSAKALHTRWLREQGRIVDRPRGYAAAQQNALDALLLLAQQLA